MIDADGKRGTALGLSLIHISEPTRLRRISYAVFLEDLFDAQHFLDLVADQQFVLENQQDVLAQRDACLLYTSPSPRD